MAKTPKNQVGYLDKDQIYIDWYSSILAREWAIKFNNKLKNTGITNAEIAYN